MLGDVAAVGGIGDFQPAEVAEILAQRQLALDVHAGDRLVGVILLHQLGGVRVV